MINFRQYKASDYFTIKALLEKAGFFDKDRDSAENLAGMIEQNPDSIIVASRGKEIIGSVFTVPYGTKVTCLFRLVVKDQFRGQGVGSMLINKAQEIAVKRGVVEIGLYVNTKDRDSIKFYRNRGFKSLDKSWIYMWKEVG